MDDDGTKKNEPPRKEHKIFTVWVHLGYTVLILSCLAWIVYVEWILD